MANAELVKILKSGVKAWNEWMEQDNTKERLDLRGADLKNADLSRAYFWVVDLHGADLRGASLCGAEIHESNLSNANLSGANLEDANFLGSNLDFAILSDAKLFSTNLGGSSMYGVDLSKATLPGADFSSVDLRESDLTGANLFGVNFKDAKLSNVNFSNCSLSHTIFGLTDLSTCIGLETVEAEFPCTIDFQTLQASKNLPKSFLLKIGLPELFIDYLPDFYSQTLTFFPAFLSHSWSNKPFARKIYEALIAKGVNVFLDEMKMKPGDDIYESLSKGIAYYDKMILICSKESLSESWWVDRELDRVLAKERQLQKERGKRINLLIPITIDDYVYSWDGAKAEEIRRYIIGDFREWQDEAKFENALNDLVHALNVDRPDIKPPSFL